MKLTSFFLFVFSIILLLGGLGGFFQGVSRASILFGTLIGLALLVGSFFVLKNNFKWLIASYLMVVAVTIYFIYRYKATGMSYPYGVMSLFSLLIVISLVGTSLKEWKNRE